VQHKTVIEIDKLILVYGLCNIFYTTKMPRLFERDFMIKFPCALVFRYDAHAQPCDSVLQTINTDCAIVVINNKQDLQLLFDSNYAVLITYGPSENEYLLDVTSIIAPGRMNRRWIHYTCIESLKTIGQGSNFCYMTNVLDIRTNIRPVFSLFTTCFESYEKINRAYTSIKKQPFVDFEWVIMDDSKDDKHFNFLKQTFCNDARIRLYKRCSNSGNIGHVKNEVVSLCRGKYLIELDHDDEITDATMPQSFKVFEDHPDVGFVYMDFYNVYEDQTNFFYQGDFFGLGYEGYYRQKVNGLWVYVCMTANINNISLSHIVGIPNHPRIWRSDTMHLLGNYNELLPINDDQELILRTAMLTKMARIATIGYVQYMNKNNNNFSLIRNGEINRIGPQYLVPMFFDTFKVDEHMQTLGAYEDPTYRSNHSQIWKRPASYEHKYCNLKILPNVTKQYLILGLTALQIYLQLIKNLQCMPTMDFILLDNSCGSSDYLCNILDTAQLYNVKCYSLKHCETSELLNYFHRLYRTCNNYEILDSNKGQICICPGANEKCPEKNESVV